MNDPESWKHEPLVIVGSRLQTLILIGVGVALAVGGDRLGAGRYVLAASCLVGAGAIAIRRVTMTADQLVIRRLLGTSSYAPGDANVAAGHRYLRVRSNGRLPFRIEVPVEIRPQTRSWAAAWQAGARSASNPG